MINQYEVPTYLVDELPEMEKELKAFSPTLNIFKSIQCLANYTKNMLIQHDLKTVKKCFEVADEVYVKGNALVKTAIENVFVYSFSSLMNLCGKDEGKQLQAIMPLYLHTVYVKQIIKSGI
jgi:hypothetical protein